MRGTIPFFTFCIVIAVGFTIVGILAATSLAMLLPKPAPEPCVYMPVEIHKPESITQAGLEAMYGANLDGGTKQ